jgi:hypothetical protein
MNPLGPGGVVIAAEGDSDGSAGGVALSAGSVDGDVAAEIAADVAGLGVAPVPPKKPVRNRRPTTATTPTAAMRIAGPALSGSPEPETGSGSTTSVDAGASSVAQFWQNTRSGGLIVPHDGHVIPDGAGGGVGVGATTTVSVV